MKTWNELFNKVNESDENVNVLDELDKLQKSKNLNQKEFICFLMDKNFFEADAIYDWISDIITDDDDNEYADKLKNLK